MRDLCVQSDFLREAVTLRDAFVYVKASQEQTPVTTLASGIMVTVTGRSDEWLIVGFNRLGSGARTGYAHCSDFRALMNEPNAGPPAIE